MDDALRRRIVPAMPYRHAGHIADADMTFRRRALEKRHGHAGRRAHATRTTTLPSRPHFSDMGVRAMNFHHASRRDFDIANLIVEGRSYCDIFSLPDISSKGYYFGWYQNRYCMQTLISVYFFTATHLLSDITAVGRRQARQCRPRSECRARRIMSRTNISLSFFWFTMQLPAASKQLN